MSQDSAKLLVPGSQVPESGVYKVIHNEHREPHFVTAIKGEVFPPCRKCRDKVRYSLALSSEYVVYDWDLSGPLFDQVG